MELKLSPPVGKSLDLSKELEHALSLYREKKYEEVVEYIDGLYGWKSSEIVRPDVPMEEHARQALRAVGYQEDYHE